MLTEDQNGPIQINKGSKLNTFKKLGGDPRKIYTVGTEMLDLPKQEKFSKEQGAKHFGFCMMNESMITLQLT